MLLPPLAAHSAIVAGDRPAGGGDNPFTIAMLFLGSAGEKSFSAVTPSAIAHGVGRFATVFTVAAVFAALLAVTLTPPGWRSRIRPDSVFRSAGIFAQRRSLAAHRIAFRL